MNNKKTLTILFMAALMLFAAGCSNPFKDEPKTKTVIVKQKTKTNALTTQTQVQTADPILGYNTPTTTTGTTPNSSAVTSEQTFFSADSPWNQRIDNSQVDRRSARMMRLAKERVGVVERAGNLPPKATTRIINDGVYINTRVWTVPIVQNGPATVVTCRQILCGDNKNVKTLNIPRNVDPDPRYDGWFTVIMPDNTAAYDLWRARRERNGTISYQFMRKWDLQGLGFNKPQTVAARGSGLPLFAGVIRPHELQTGSINHALSISVPGPAQRNYVQPASVTDGNGKLGSLPEGARIRLKAGVVLKGKLDPKTGRRQKLTKAQRRVGDAIILALRQYGAIVVDRAAVPTLYGQRDVTTKLIKGNELEGITLDDFEVLELPEILKDPPLTTINQSGPQVSEELGSRNSGDSGQ